MAHILLLPFGSAGDVLPFLWLGRQLQARGHRITLISACLFEDPVKAAGLGFIPIGTKSDYEALMRNPRIWKAGTGTRLVLEIAVNAIEPYLAAVESADPVDLLVAPCTSFGARLAREKLGIPLVTVHLQPMVILSAHDTPLLHPLLGWVRFLPVWLKRLAFSLPNPVDILALPSVRRICRTHGVTPPHSLWREWWDSPDGVLALFPAWFGQPQPDWPANLLQWTFPLEDLGKERALQPELLAFLAAGERPVVFTPGSANLQADTFFEVAATAVKSLGCRAVFVTRDPGQVPAGLPASILTVDYAPFSTLLRHACVFVHHGGVGTMAQGLAAGVPQLIMAMAHDQPDNARRLQILGAGIGLGVKQFTPARVTRALRRLRGESGFADAAGACAGMLRQARDPEELMRWLEARVAGCTGGDVNHRRMKKFTLPCPIPPDLAFAFHVYGE